MKISIRFSSEMIFSIENSNRYTFELYFYWLNSSTYKCVKVCVYVADKRAHLRKDEKGIKLIIRKHYR